MGHMAHREIRSSPLLAGCSLILYVLIITLPLAFTTFTADPTDVKVLIVNLSVVFLMLCRLIRLAKSQSLEVSYTFLDISVLLWLAWNIIMAIAARYRWACLSEVTKLAGYIIIYFAVCAAGTEATNFTAKPSDFVIGSKRKQNVFGPLKAGDTNGLSGQLGTLISIFVVSSVVPCLYGLLQHAGLDPLVWAYPSSERVLSTFGNPTYFAAYLVVAIPVTLLVLLHQRSVVGSAGCLLLLALQHANLLWTWSRGPWLALAVGLFLQFGISLMFRSNRSFIAARRVTTTLGLGVIVVVTWSVSRGSGLSERAASAINKSDPSNIQRVLQWKAGWAVFREHVVTGVGPGNLRIHMAEKLTPAFFRTGVATASEHAHNEFIEIAAETGVIGLALFLLIIMVVFCGAVRTCKRGGTRGFVVWSFWGSIVGLLLCNTVGVSMRYSTGALYFWVFVGLVSAICREQGVFRVTRKSRDLSQLEYTAALAVSSILILCCLVLAWLPFVSSIYQRRGDVFFQQNRMAEAENPYKVSLKFSPNNVASLYNLAIVYTATDRYGEALATYERLSRLWPDIGRIHFNLGSLYLAIGDLEKARFELERAAEIDGLPDTWAHLSRVYELLGDIEKANEASRRAKESSLLAPELPVGPSN